MRILYVTTIGITMGFFKPLVHELIDQGNTVDIATNENSGDTPIPGCYREWGCRVYPLSCTRSPLNKGNYAVIAEIRRLAKNGEYDLIHCHTPIAAACTRIACKGLRKNGLKVFYTAHGFHFYKGAPLKNWLLYYPVEWLCAHWTDVLITINREDFDLAKKHMHAKRVEYVPGVGIDVKKFSDIQVDRAAKRKEIGVPEDATLLLSVGELNRDKNHEVVLHALQRIGNRNLFYAIAGIGDKHDYLLQLASNLGISEQILLLGYRRDIPELLAISDLFVFPSIFEGLPVSVMEAVAAGIPVVCSSCRGNTDIVTDRNYQFKFNSADQLASVITYAVTHDNQNYIADNRERLHSFKTDKITRKIMKIYQKYGGEAIE